MPTANVRTAHAGDLETVLALLAELGRPCSEPDDEHRRQAAEVLGRDDTEVLIAELDGEAAGLACLMVMPRLGHRTTEARLLDLIVTEEGRSKGVGSALVAAVAARAGDAGCHLLRLECGHRRVEAHRWYERLGFEDRGLDWQLPLPHQILL
ncbi:MAG: GNAT family N-acetyltransferase [Actinobacteria bacterium]|nr:GNAT family N-acetyltransferase [Actinomycetota bacterium]